jgi:hypothetical protein
MIRARGSPAEVRFVDLCLAFASTSEPHVPEAKRLQEDAMSKTKPHFSNRSYRAELSRMLAGSPIVKIVPIDPKSPSAHHRRIAVFLYDLASEMERRSEELGADWVISVEAWSSRVMVELSSVNDSKAADEFLAALLSDWNLA